TSQLWEPAQLTVTAVLRRGRRRGSDRPRRGATDIAEPIHPGQLTHRQRVDDTAGNAALHDDVALASRAGIALWVSECRRRVLVHSPHLQTRRGPLPCG